MGTLINRFRSPLLAGLTVVLLWVVLVRGYADYLAQVSPTRAEAVYAGQPTALSVLAEEQLRAGDAAAAQRLAERAILSSAFSGEAWRVLGAVAERNGEDQVALERMRHAAALAPRDSAAQFWLAIHALRDKRIDEAVDRLDRLMRFQPETHNDVFPIMATIATNRAGANSVAARLADNPVWRSDFTVRLFREMPSSDVARNFLRALRRAGAELTVAEVNAYSDRLANQDPLALRDWLKEFDKDPALLNNGGFDSIGPYKFLDWQVEHVAGADIQLPKIEAGKSVLRVEFYNQRVRFDGVRQSLLLRPGRYSLAGQVRSDIRAAQGLRWTFICPESQQVSQSIVGSTPWQSFEMSFSVDDSCTLGLLRLEVHARIAAERHLDGWVEFDEFSLTPVAQ